MHDKDRHCARYPDETLTFLKPHGVCARDRDFVPGLVRRTAYSPTQIKHDALRLICRAVSAKVAYDRSETITENEMNIHVSAGPLVSLLAGILILIVPRLLNYIVAIYLIIIGLLGLFGASIPHLR